MRKLIKIALVVLGIRAFLRWRKKRRAQHAADAGASPAADPADELRRKLAESRAEEDVAAPAPPDAEVADRRADVHEQGRTTIDEMKSSSEG